MSNKDYCYKIHTLLMKKVLNPLLQPTPLYGLPPSPRPAPPPILKENLAPSSMISQKCQTPYK